MSQMRLRRANLVDKRQNPERRQRTGVTQSEQKTSRTSRSSKVIDRDAVIDQLSHLRDLLDQVIECVNDLAVVNSLPGPEGDLEWLDAGELSEDEP